MAARRQTDLELVAANDRFSAQIDEIDQLRDQLREQAIRDPLTGLFNCRYPVQALDVAIARARRSDLSVSVILLDINRFKQTNDTWGRPVGDTVLQTVAALLSDSVRDADIVCRYGGEEFLILLPAMSPSVALQCAEALRQAVERRAIAVDGGAVSLTIVLGVAGYPRDALDPAQLVHVADLALYCAKAAGWNQTLVGRAGMVALAGQREASA